MAPPAINNNDGGGMFDFSNEPREEFKTYNVAPQQTDFFSFNNFADPVPSSQVQ